MNLRSKNIHGLRALITLVYISGRPKLFTKSLISIPVCGLCNLTLTHTTGYDVELS